MYELLARGIRVIQLLLQANPLHARFTLVAAKLGPSGYTARVLE